VNRPPHSFVVDAIVQSVTMELTSVGGQQVEEKKIKFRVYQCTRDKRFYRIE
jgi:hypothetical protein